MEANEAEDKIGYGLRVETGVTEEEAEVNRETSIVIEVEVDEEGEGKCTRKALGSTVLLT